MLEDMTVTHPGAWTVVWQPGDLHLAHRRNMNSVFPGTVRRRFAVDGQDLEEEAVKVKWVVHRGAVDDFPDLQLADADRIAVVVTLTIDSEVPTTTKARAARKENLPSCLGVDRRERLDRAKLFRDARD